MGDVLTKLADLLVTNLPGWSANLADQPDWQV